MKIILLFIFLLISSTAFSQASEADYPDFSGKTLSEVDKTKRWIVIEKAEGYLNSDQIKDVAVILQSGSHHFKSCSESADLLADEERIILVLISNDGKPKVTIQNNRFIARPDDGGMTCYLKPSISAKKHKLNISYQYTRAHRKYNFAYRDGDMILVRAETFDRHAASGNFSSNTFDFIGKKIFVKEGNISSDSVSTKSIPIKYDGYKKLSEFGEMYEWEIAEYKYL